LDYCAAAGANPRPLLFGSRGTFPKGCRALCWASI
jgi:hypothetical protein